LRNINIKLLCRLEGISIELRQITITQPKDLPPIAELYFPSVKELNLIRNRTSLEVYYLDKGVLRILFTGEISGKNYSRQAGGTSRVLAAIIDTNYLNDLPSKYLNTMSIGGGSYEYKFYGMPVEAAARYQIEQEYSNEFAFTEMGSYARKGLIQYMDHFMDVAIGSKCWEKYYYNAGERLKIKENHVLFDSGLFKEAYTAKRIAAYLKKVNAEASGSEGQVLDSLLNRFRQLGFGYINIITPAYNTTLMSSPDPAEGSEVKPRRSANSIARHVLTPDVKNIIPPKCNVISVGKNAQMRVNIKDNVITRLLNNYYILSDEGDPEIPAYCAIYPRSLSKSAQEGKNPFLNSTKDDFGMTEEELDTGMKPHTRKNDFIFNHLLGRATDPEVMKGNQGLFNKLTQFDFYKIRYSANSLSVTLPGVFNPYLVTGLPGLVYDESADMFYYGQVDMVTHSLSIEDAQAGTYIQMSNVREISDVREISSTLSGDIYKCVKMSPFIPQDIYNPIANGKAILNDSGLTPLTETFYSVFLQGEGGDGQGWQSILDGEYDVDGKPLDLDLMLLRIKSKLLTYNESYYSRSIATAGDYTNTMKGYEEERAGSNELIAQDERFEQMDLVERKLDTTTGDVYVKQRQDMVLKLKKALANTVIVD